MGASVGTGHYDARIMAVLVAVDDVNAALRAYVLHRSNGDNAARWPDYQAAAGATLDEIASAVRRLSAMPRRSCTMPQRRRSAAPPPADPPAAPCRAMMSAWADPAGSIALASRAHRAATLATVLQAGERQGAGHDRVSG